MPNGGLPFFKYFDETDKVIYPDDAQYKTLWPENCPLADDVREQIKVHFCNYLTNFAYPQYWLSRFHNLVNREADKWIKLIESESALRPDDAIYNYDIQETTHYTTNGESSTTSSNESNTTTEESNTTKNTGYTSDTPEGSVADIETFMSAASHQDATSTGNGTTGTTGSGTQNNTGSSTGDQTLTRKGNIGVMTSAQIIGGYREAIAWCAYDEVIFPELEKLFIGIWERDDDYGYFYTETI